MAQHRVREAVADFCGTSCGTPSQITALTEACWPHMQIGYSEMAAQIHNAIEIYMPAVPPNQRQALVLSMLRGGL